MYGSWDMVRNRRKDRRAGRRKKWHTEVGAPILVYSRPQIPYLQYPHNVNDKMHQYSKCPTPMTYSSFYNKQITFSFF